MRFKLRTLFIAVLLAAFVTPISIRIYHHYNPRPFFVGQTVFLCTTSGKDTITHTHITNLLSSHGINSITEGSRACGTKVEKSRLDDAIKLLEQSSSDGVPTIKLHRNERGGLWVSGDESKTFNERFNTHVDDIINTNDRHANLIFAIKNSASRFYRSFLNANRLPIVVSVSGIERKYLDQNGTMQTGYVVELDLANHLDNATAKFTERYQIMDDCRYIRFTSGNGTGDLPDDP